MFCTPATWALTLDTTPLRSLGPTSSPEELWPQAALESGESVRDAPAIRMVREPFAVRMEGVAQASPADSTTTHKMVNI